MDFIEEGDGNGIDADDIEQAVTSVASDEETSATAGLGDGTAGDGCRAGGGAVVAVVVDADVKFVSKADGTTGHIEHTVAAFMTEADPTACDEAAGRQVDHTIGRVGRCRCVAVTDADEVVRGNRSVADIECAGAVTGAAGIITTDDKLVTIGLGEGGSIGNGERSSALFTDVDTPGVLGVAGTRAIDEHVGGGSWIDPEAEPPVLDHLTTIGDVDGGGGAILPAAEEVTAARGEVLEQGTIGHVHVGDGW